MLIPSFKKKICKRKSLNSRKPLQYNEPVYTCRHQKSTKVVHVEMLFIW